jgi:hypothetical protein
LLIKVQEVFAPNLHYGVTILGAVAGIDPEDSRGRVVSERKRVRNVAEVARETDCEGYYLRLSAWRAVITLQTSFILKF